MNRLGAVSRGVAAGLALTVLAGCGAATKPARSSAATSTSGSTSRSTSGSGSGSATTGTTAGSTSTAKAVKPRRHFPAYPVFSGLGTLGPRWHAVVTVRGRTAAWVAQRDGVTLLRFDQRVAQLVLHAGSVDPGAGPWRHGDAIRGRELGRVIAAFNSGFKLDTGSGGWQANGHTAVALSPGRASIVTYRNGRTDIGAWGQGVPSHQPIASVRQNLYLLVNHGVAASTVSSCIQTCWGATVGGVLSVARSALGIDGQGRLIYGAIASAEPATLAQGLIDGGVRRAAELDINPDWVAAYFYRHHRHGPPQWVQAIPGQYGVYGHFLLPYSRDFFSVVER